MKLLNCCQISQSQPFNISFMPPSDTGSFFLCWRRKKTSFWAWSFKIALRGQTIWSSDLPLAVHDRSHWSGSRWSNLFTVGPVKVKMNPTPTEIRQRWCWPRKVGCRPPDQIHVMWFCSRPVHNQMESNLAEKLDSFLGSEGQLNGAEPSLHLWNVLQMRDVAKVHCSFHAIKWGQRMCWSYILSPQCHPVYHKHS